ncbi:MATE family efflux transporter [Persicimonas caeni]|uniref:MATE family efflux transporter n=1 Tax=Persicimonas caeni TaxID=2292766 RepID=A0A4Y6PVI4_PERCE|nr:MATE family efflux transporter [Persicimonas caeni]QDG52361.1 MATE family efflux transporter [Persicimonas caeni]QED33583.1 MATE family efflux transporter [Persicimonas caeni]
MKFSALRHKHDPEILRLAVPALGSLAVDPLVSLVDTAFVGQLGTAPLGALGINASLFAMTFVIFNFLAYGTTPRVGNALGRGDRKAAGQVVIQAFTLALAAGALALALLQIFAGPILTLMGATGELREPAMTYLRIRAFAGPAVLLLNVGHGAFRGYQDTRTAMVVTIALNLVNLVLDPILIFGLGWGIAGAATATVIAQWLGALTFVWLLLKSRREELGIELVRPTLEQMLPFLRIGSSLLLRTGALVGTMTLATAVAARVGVVAVAAHQVANQLWGFLALVVDALAVAAQALVAKHLGSGDVDEARDVSDRLLQWGLGVGAVLALGFAALRPVLPGLFTDEAQTVARVMDIFIFVAVLQPINGVVFVWDGIYMGAEKFGFLAKAMVVSAAGAVAVLLLTRPMGWGLEGVWWGITALMLVRVVTLGVPYARRRVFAKPDDVPR